MTDSVWPSVMLIDVADLRLSSVDKKFTPGEKRVRLCNYTDVYNHSVLRADLDYMEGTATEREIRNCQLKVGDVVITKDSEAPNDIGVPALVGEEIANLVCGYHLAILRPKEATLDGEFLYFAIGTNDAKRQFQKCANGITRFGLRGGDINRVTIPLPQLSEQRKIAAILSSVDDAIEKTQAVIDQVQVVKRGLMQELLTRGLPGRHSGHKQTEVGRIPENWRVIPLSDVGVWSSGGTPDKQEERFWAGTIPWVSPKDMKQARIADTIDHVSEAAIGNGTRLAPRGTILIVVRGMILAHTFPVALTERDVAFNQDIKALVSNTDYDPEFLLYWF